MLWMIHFSVLMLILGVRIRIDLIPVGVYLVILLHVSCQVVQNNVNVGLYHFFSSSRSV